jgi:poly(3-hydroxybutyrate) depolymerase
LLVAGGGAVVGAAGLGAGLVEAGVLPGRARVHRLVGLTGPDGVVPPVDPGPSVSGSFVSASASASARRATVGWTLCYPPGVSPGARLPVVVLLHGRGGDHRFPVSALGIDRYLAAARLPMVLAAVDGGPDSYWHPRAGGSDPVRMLRSEFLPMLASRGLRVSRIGLLGWSMGGYGALLYAVTAGRGVAVAAVAVSPALWRSFEDTAPGAFDDAADFREHTVFGRSFDGVALRVDCGRDDPFADAVRSFRSSLPVTPAGGLQAGDHTAGYWRRMLPDQLAFLGQHLVR